MTAPEVRKVLAEQAQKAAAAWTLVADQLLHDDSLVLARLLATSAEDVGAVVIERLYNQAAQGLDAVD